MTHPRQWPCSRQERVGIAIDYYSKPAVRRRILESLGESSAEDSSAVFISANDDTQDCRTGARDPAELHRCLDEGKEIYRSLWDRKHLVANLDVEYVNIDDPVHPFERFNESYAFQEPVVHAIQTTLRRFGIFPQHVLSGRGHHFTWNIRRDSPAFLELAQLGKLPPTVLARYSHPCSPRAETIGQPLARAFAGLGLVMEHLAHEVSRVAASRSPVPLTITAVETCSHRGVRECVSLDLSEYGDPLHTRLVRVPYSVYYKPLQQEHRLGPKAVNGLPPIFMLPIGRTNEPLARRRMRNANLMAQAARKFTARIPEHSVGMAALIRNYRSSRLAEIHNWFYEQEHEPPERWPCSYDVTGFDVLPPSAQKILQEPNDLLLKPGCLRHIVRIFLALGWHPRHIAGLVRSKYERDYGWGNEWFDYDAATRADFYCRAFTGLILAGLDTLEDFSCPPAGVLCDYMPWNEDLAPFKESLNRRRQHDRLASRPFHRLFL